MSTARARTAGLTLIEVLVASVLVSMVVVSASWGLSQASTAKHILEEQPVNAAVYAREIHELAQSLPTTPSGKLAATGAADILALDSLDGAKLSPPINSAKQALPDAEFWQQLVDVQTFDFTDTSKPVSESVLAAGKSSTTLYKLTVQIKFRNTDMGTWWWWINP